MTSEISIYKIYVIKFIISLTSSKAYFKEHIVLGLIKFWEKLVTRTITHVKKQSTTSTTGKLFQLLFCIGKGVCINFPVINIILKFNMDHEVGSQSQWNKIRFVLEKETNTFTLMLFALLV